MTEMQKQFEEWFKRSRTGNVQKIDGEYVHGATERLWQAWQASRAAIVVKLPLVNKTDWESKLDLLEEFKDRLNDAGVGYE